MQAKLKEIIETDCLEERKNKVAKIFSEAAQEYVQSNEYVEDLLYPGYFSSAIGITFKNHIIQ